MEHVPVVVVGAGFAGLAAAIKLREAGERFVVLERAADLGGTWRDNTYPGCACDVPSHVYSFSFAPNPDWTRAFSPQPEILAYLQRTAREHGVLPAIRFSHEVLAAVWQEDARRWLVRTSAGELTADVLIVGSGPLSEPKEPDLAGLETFAGTTFHSAAWRHDVDLTGKRVAVVGTGASAVQFLPAVAAAAGAVSVFQRTPPWVLPRRDRPISPARRWVYRHYDPARRLTRAATYLGRESWILGFSFQPALMRLAERQAREFLARCVADPGLRDALTPRYRLGCKRVLLSNDYYPTLTRPHVRLVTDRLVGATPTGLCTEGSEHPFDVVIFATGFHVTDPPIARRITGRGGRSLAADWTAGGMRALHGTAVPGYPNLFFLVGPNTGLGHNSIVVMIEAQVRYVLDLLARLRGSGAAAVEARPEAVAAYNDRLQRRLATTVWNSGGCASWYLDENGRNTTLWPTFTFSFARELRRADLADYRLIPAARPQRELVPA